MELQKKLDELGSAFEQFKKTNDERLNEIKAKGQASAATEEKLSKVEGHITKLEASIEAMTKALNRTGNGAEETEESKNKKELQAYKSACREFMRKGVALPAEMQEFAKKAMSVDSDDDGGFFVDPEMNGKITSTIFESSPVRQLAEVMTISSDSYKFLHDDDEAAAEWVGEVQARNETASPTIKELVIPVHELHASPKATQKLLDDAAVNLEAWLSGKVADKFARSEASAFISGNGVGKPKGILAYANASAGFGKVEVSRTASATALAGDDLISVQHKLKEGYQKNASWLVNRLITGEVRKLKDSVSGQYLWQPGLREGTPNVLLGRPVYFASDLDSTLAIDKYTAIYGDIKAGYLIVDRVGIRVLRDPYTAKPYVSFYTTKRVGGGVQNFEALKIMQQKAN
jgi:HK97 family phage major capsid protein